MNEQELRMIMQSSMASPSEDFVTELMSTLPSSVSSLNHTPWVRMFLSIACLVLLFFVMGSSQGIVAFEKSVSLPSIYLQLGGIFFLLYECNRVVMLFRSAATRK
jgi:hypothetical protein